MTERQSGEFFNPGVDHKPSVNGVDTSFGYNKRRMDEKTDELVRLAREAHEADKDFQFVNDNKSVVSDEKIYGTIDRMFEIDREVNTVLAGNTAKENDLFDEDKVNDGFVGEKTFWEKFQEGVIGSKVVKRVSSLIVAAATMFQLGSAIPVRADESTPAPADPSATHSAEVNENITDGDFPTTIEGYTPAPGNPLEDGTNEGYLTLDYDDRKNGIAECKKEMVENDCLPQFLNFYSELLYVRRTDGGSPDNKYDWPERTILGYHVSDEDIFESGRTGKPVGKLQLVYFKDKEGNITDEPALGCVFDSDYNIGVETFQEAVYRLEKDCPGFLRSLRKNNVIAFVQANARDGIDGGAKYTQGTIFVGYSKIDKKDDTKEEIIKQLMTYLPVEGFGCRAFVLVGDECEYSGASGEIKSKLNYKWSLYMYKKTKDKFYKTKAKEAEGWYKNYVKQSIYTKEELADILKKVENENLVYPYGVDSWDEINKVISK